MISVVIPIFNEEELIPILHAAVQRVMNSLHEEWEVIYVDDGSRDASLELLLREQRFDPHVRIVQLSRNWGHQPALTAGIETARGDAVIMMDGDLQDPPELIPEMVKAWHEGAEVVIPQRRSRQERGLRGMLFPMFYKVLSAVSDYPIPINAGIFGLLDRRAVDAINLLPEGNRYFPGLRAWVGFKTATIFYDRAERLAGTPKQTLRRLLKYSSDAIYGFSLKPLRASLYLGVLCLAVAFILPGSLLGLAAVENGWNGVRESFGSAALWFGLLLVGGFQLVCLGFVGQYVGRIYDEVRRRPLYLVSKIHEHKAAAVPVSVGRIAA
jgi:glycosyltransferase involved in cell wall biosynthesis